MDSIPWTEKYRPTRLDQVADHSVLVKYLGECLRTGQLNHLLLYGQAGAGKSSVAGALACELFGIRNITYGIHSNRLLELNASKDRGIDVVRTKIKDFVVKKPISENNENKSNKSNKSIFTGKLIILDEADSMTKDSQNSLRRYMETYSDTTKFIFICNYVGKIIPAILSRCVQFRFQSLTFDNCKQKLQHIAERESVEIKDGALWNLIKFGQGDLRKCITSLQTAKAIATQKVKSNKHELEDDLEQKTEKEEVLITETEIDLIFQTIPKGDVQNIVKIIHQPFFEPLIQLSQHYIDSGYSIQDIFKQYLPLIFTDEKLTDAVRSKFIMRIAETDTNLCLGNDEYLECLSTLSYLFQLVH